MSKSFIFRHRKQYILFSTKEAGNFYLQQFYGEKKAHLLLKSISFTESNLTYFFKNSTQYLVGAPTAFFSLSHDTSRFSSQFTSLARSPEVLV